MEKKETKMKMAKMPFSAHGSSGVVDVLHNGRWYKATVLSVDTASLATVRYAVDGSVESKVEDPRIRPRQKAQSAAAKVQQQNSDLGKRSPARGAPMVKGPPDANTGHSRDLAPGNGEAPPRTRSAGAPTAAHYRHDQHVIIDSAEQRQLNCLSGTI